MSIIATAVRHLMAAGVTGEALVAAIADMEANQAPAVDPVAEKRRAYDRERKRNKVSGGIPVESAESVESAPSLSPPNENNLTPPIPTPVNILPTRKGIDFPMLDCTDSVTWRDFLKNRKAKNLQNTPTAHKRLVKDLAEMAARTGWPPGSVFEACVAKGWGAIYDPRDKENGNNRSNQNNPSRNGRPVDGFAAALRQVADGSFDEPFAINR
jgi:hypothetical protein